MTEDRQIALFEKFKQTVASSQKHVFAPTEILFLITHVRAEHPFPRSLSERKFQRSLIDSGVLKEISLTASYSFETTRYHVGLFSDYELALSLKPGAYLSHGTAAHLHNLIDQEPKTIYVNKEQSPKKSLDGILKPRFEPIGVCLYFKSKKRVPTMFLTSTYIGALLAGAAFGASSGSRFTNWEKYRL